MYYRGAQAAIVVYDITNQVCFRELYLFYLFMPWKIGHCLFDGMFQESFAKAKNWVKELQRQASPNIVIALAGNKADLASKRLVEYEEAQAYAEDNGLLFMETSAKSSMNVNDIFLAIAKKLPRNESGGGPAGRGHGGINVTEEAPQQKKTCCN